MERRVTGHKRSFGPGNTGSNHAGPPQIKPPPSNVLSRCDVREVFLTSPIRGSSPDFPVTPTSPAQTDPLPAIRSTKPIYNWPMDPSEARLERHLGIYCLLPPSMSYLCPDAFQVETTTPAIPAPPATPADTGLFDALLEACHRQAKGQRATLIARTLHQVNSVQDLIAHCLSDNHCRDAQLPQAVLALVKWCNDQRAKDFLTSLFLVMQRPPHQGNREGFIASLPKTFSPELSAHEEDARRYWSHATISGRSNAEAKEQARQVCAHFGWLLDT